MEEKQLDFNAPLLSVRRFTPAAASRVEESKRNDKLPNRPFPSYRSDLKSGPVRNAGAVPFQWEQTPGRPKDGSVRLGTPEKPPLVPKLPPGRVLEHRQSSLKKNAVDKEPEASTQTTVRQPDKLISWPGIRSSGGNVALPERPKLDTKEEDDADSDDHDDEVFSDAVDTISRTDSQYMNCSLSGLSALDGPGSRHSGNLSTDSRTRDFMIDRFLPAAVAMASETPQYPSRKRLVVREPVKPVNGDRKPLPYQCRPRVVTHHHTHDVETEDSKSEDEDYDDSGNLTAKACGLLPRFCLKSSFCLLNPVPGMKIRNSIPSSPVGRKLHRQTGPVLSRYLTDSVHEHTWEAVFDHKLAHGIEPPEAHENGSKPTSDSNRLTYWSDSQTPDGSSPCRRSTGDGISPYRSETPCSPFHERVAFLGTPRLGKNFKSGSVYMHGKVHTDYQETSSQESSKHGSSSGSPSVEKTLYVDSIQALGTPNSRSSSLDTMYLMNSAEKDVNIHAEAETLQKDLVLTTDVDSSNGIKLGKGQEILQNTITDIVEVNHSSYTNGSAIGGHENNVDGLRCYDALGQEVRSLEFSRALINENPGLDDLKNSKEKDEGDECTNYLQSPLPPPLPKSPSESWLWRTLPAVSSTNSSNRPYLGIQFRSMRHVAKSSSLDPKWETMVKTANVHHGRTRFSEELKTPGSKQSMG